MVSNRRMSMTQGCQTTYPTGTVRPLWACHCCGVSFVITYGSLLSNQALYMLSKTVSCSSRTLLSNFRPSCQIRTLLSVGILMHSTQACVSLSLSLSLSVSLYLFALSFPLFAINPIAIMRCQLTRGGGSGCGN